MYPFFTKAIQHLPPLGTSPLFIAFYLLRPSIHGSGNSRCVEGENFPVFRLKRCKNKVCDFWTNHQRARMMWIFSLRLFQRLANPSLGYSSNCISSRLWPLERNLHIVPCPHLFHSLYCWAVRIGIGFSYKLNLCCPLENGKFLSYIISAEPRNNWLSIFCFYQFLAVLTE